MSKIKISKYGKVLLYSSFLLIVLGLVTLFATKAFKVEAQDTETVTTSVTVGNTAPSFTAGPAEATASTSTAPTAIGSSVTFNATAADANGENYYLIVCSTNSVTAGTSGNAPTCAVGATTYCTSSSTASASAASCSYTTKSADPWSNAWYAFVCDANATTAACSAGSQGSGSDGTESPFFVNHPPTFTSVSNNSPKDPGTSVTWTTQTTSDPDTGNTVKLLVCKSNTAPTNGACSGGASGTWCSSSAVASNPTCSYSVPNPNPDGSNNAYAFVVDNFNLLASSTPKNSHFTVNNIAPVVSAVTFNSGNNINLAESTTTAITVTATVTDNNGCSGGEIANVYAYAYRSGITYTGCDTSGEGNANNCYPEISCTVVGGSCTGPSDATANYTCTINFQYFADPTDTGTLYDTQNWLATVKAVDNNSASHNLQVTTGVEMNSLVAFSVTNTLEYGSLNVLGKNDPLDKTLTTTATGNVGLDQSHHGAANMCTNFSTCTGGTPIPVGKQKYALAASTAYSSATALTTSAVEVELNLAKPTSTTAVTKNTWWGIEIPSGTLPGEYTGENTITAIKGETADW